MQAGVLALQGGFEPHVAMLARLGVRAREVRSVEALREVTHLVLPGGESTTLHHLLGLFGMWDELRERHHAGKLALFGTCAGAILLGRGDGERPPRLELLDAVLARNAYGRQVDSFTRELDVLGQPMACTFIRAPRIVSVGPDVRVLARLGDDPVLVEAKGVLAATFHPELGHDPRVHERFLALETAQLSTQTP
ncbi:MAG: pyridoxal 5'-phosphate synthase glutaminase subunit PdxT [Planctomycetaceae bacterium]|jgi:5'-phosphate synthase pdxT subunit|nr:pyridoxal 5'-phosphate synthase glutaminase subunit PdxT [Planctomycetaceae bacterium]